MIRLSPGGRAIYGLLSHCVRLLVLLAISHFLAEYQSLPIPTVLTDNLISFHNIRDNVSHTLILTGCITGGLVMCLHRIHHQTMHGLWVGWVILSPIAIIISPAVLVIGLFGVLILTFNRSESRFLSVWQVGIGFLIVGLISQSTANSPIIDLITPYTGYAITSVAISFWLMTQWSNIRAEWANDGVLNVTGAVIVASILLHLATFHLPSPYAIIASLIILACYSILAGHHYRALRDPQPDMSLSPHWLAMATIYWLAVGFMSVVTVNLPNTHFIHVTHNLIMWTMLLITLSLINYTARWLRGENRRVTGYIPLWLIGFGIGLTSITDICTAIINIYLTEIILLNPTTIEGLLLPLDIANLICWLGLATGIISYALGFVARRPKIIVS